MYVCSYEKGHSELGTTSKSRIKISLNKFRIVFSVVADWGALRGNLPARWNLIVFKFGLLSLNECWCLYISIWQGDLANIWSMWPRNIARQEMECVYGCKVQDSQGALPFAPITQEHILSIPQSLVRGKSARFGCPGREWNGIETMWWGLRIMARQISVNDKMFGKKRRCFHRIDFYFY